MKKKLCFTFISIIMGIGFTFYFLNQKYYYAKEEYILYAFQIGAFENYDNAMNYSKNIPSMIINENNLYKVYSGIYKNLDVVNKMLVYFEDNNIKIYLKSIKVSKKFYNEIDNFEKILINTNDSKVYNKINESILKLYQEGI